MSFENSEFGATSDRYDRPPPIDTDLANKRKRQREDEEENIMTELGKPRPGQKGGRRRAKAVVFTMNNYKDNEVESIKDFGISECRYMVFGFEVGLKGTPHLQGFCQLKKQWELTKITRAFRWWCEPNYGTPEQASEYCKKGGNYHEYGKLTSPQICGREEKERWVDIIRLAKEGDMDKINELYPSVYLHHYQTLIKIRRDYMARPPDHYEGTTGYWIYGCTGVGKSRSVREECELRNEAYYVKNNNKWWDGYLDEPNVIIDDVDKSSACLGHHFKIWADRYAFLAETKGSAMYCRPKRIIITSQYTPEEIWTDDSEMVAAIRRRFRFMHLLTYDPSKSLFV